VTPGENRKPGNPELETETMTTATAKPKIPKISKHHQAIVQAIETVDPLRMDWMETGNPVPTADLYDAIEDLILTIVADESDVAWPRSTWRVLEAADDAANVMHLISQVSWRSAHVRPPGSLWSALGKMFEVRGDLISPPPAQGVRRIQLETLEQLDKLPNINDQAIALVWGLKDDNGQPDKDRVRRIREGKEEAPTETILPPEDDGWPKRRPHFGLLASIADELKADREENK